MVTDYKVIQATSRDIIIADVQTSIKEGWQPIGAVTTTQDRQFVFSYFQALVKSDNSATNAALETLGSALSTLAVAQKLLETSTNNTGNAVAALVDASRAAVDGYNKAAALLASATDSSKLVADALTKGAEIQAQWLAFQKSQSSNTAAVSVRTVKAYKIVDSSTLAATTTLVDTVLGLIGQGWELLGPAQPGTNALGKPIQLQTLVQYK